MCTTATEVAASSHSLPVLGGEQQKQGEPLEPPSGPLGSIECAHPPVGGCTANGSSDWPLLKRMSTPRKGLKKWKKTTYQMYDRRHSWTVSTASQRILPCPKRSRRRELVVEVLEPVDRDLQPRPSGVPRIFSITLVMEPLNHGPRKTSSQI